MPGKIAVQLLVGRNEEPFLPYAIQSVAWADYFTVVNTAPDSREGMINRDIVDDLIPPEKLRYTELVPADGEMFSFADARNLCLSMTDQDDYVFIVDADDVHFPQWEDECRSLIAQGADSITAYFYHLMVYKNLYQYVQPREIIYKNSPGTKWAKGVHEQLTHHARNPRTSMYHYMHYGYIKPQSDVFRRWKFYSDLEGDFSHYDGQNPDTILADRVAVCQELPVQHPDIIQTFLDRNYENSPEGAVRVSPARRGSHGEEHVGLVLLTKDDAHLLDGVLSSLAETTGPPSFDVMAIDCNSSDGSVDKLVEWSKKVPFDMEVIATSEYTSLAETLNYAFDHFRTDERYRYVGWVHPDMDFCQKEWLHFLWLELQEHPEIGKISAANFRDRMPDEIIPGHEQCYILRKDILHKIGLFDEKYIGIGGYEDWDMNRRIQLHQGPEGFYQVAITPRAWCYHEGMATRSRRDTTQEQMANSRYYYNKWGTYEPPC